MSDALEIRRRVQLAYDAAERERDPVRRAQWLTFATVGAGPPEWNRLLSPIIARVVVPQRLDDLHEHVAAQE